ncbi:AfsR/SARP family transcriptional regulator [Dactylosporangium salmoneum]|uniref:AfsR/SARP family transcriptional regulator n=1 Tax=Dactylosporangium salmoneum TaxID=53361 RepID=UPI0031D22373
MDEIAQEEHETDGIVRFGLFGYVRLVRDGVAVEITQPKQRGILSMLLAAPSELVTLSELIDTLWPGEPAASVVNQVHRHIGALRRLCEPDLPPRHKGRYIASAGRGYRLMLDAENSDVLRFRALAERAGRLVESGHRRDALRLYLAALDIASAPAGDDRLRALPVFVGLEDERIRAVVAAATLCETADDHAAVLPVLRAVGSRHLLDESLRAHEIAALHRTGRLAEALAVYRTVREALRDELGTSPGAALETAHALALRDGASEERSTLSPTDTVPAQLPSPLPTFTGRRAELAALASDRVASGRLLITGMAGVGKTSLALRHAADVADHFPDGQLYVNLRGFDAAARPTDPLDALQDLLHGLGVVAQAMPDSLGARSGLLRSRLAGRRVLLVLDNARDYHQVEPLLPGAGDNLTIITSRNALTGLVAFNQVEPIVLEPFDDEEAVEFFVQRLPRYQVRDHREALVRLGRACGGLPLALAVMAARAQVNPHFPLDLFVSEFAVGGPVLPVLNAGSAEVDLSNVISWSRQGLTDDAARVFAVLSAHPGPEISAAAAVSMSGLGGRRTREVLDELARANVLRPTKPERYAFHDLVREYATELLGDGFADASRRLVNHYVHSAGRAIASFGQTPTARAADVLNGVVAEEFMASTGATAWYAEHRHVLHAVFRRALDLGDHRSALLLMLDWRPMSQAIDARRDMLPFAELAIGAAEQVDDLAVRAEVYRDAASNFARTDQHGRARTYFEKAVAAYRQSGDALGLAAVYRSMGVTLPMDSAERIAMLQQSVAVVRELDDQPTLAMSYHSLGLGYLWAGRCEDALAAFDEARQLAGPAGNLLSLEPHILSGRSRALARAGRFEEAADDAERALKIFRRDGAAHAELRLLHSHGAVLAQLGRSNEAAEAWRRYLTLATGPEHIRETNALDDDTDGATTIARVRAQLATLSAHSR